MKKNMGIHSTVILFWVCLACLFSPPALAATVTYTTHVKVIQAAEGLPHVDPGIQSIVREMKSVFKYTQYRLIKTQTLTLGENQEGRMALPGRRTLVMTPVNRADSRITYRIRIEKNRSPVFRTQVMLLNHSSITIGGPRFKNGVLLFNIQGNTP